MKILLKKIVSVFRKKEFPERAGQKKTRGRKGGSSSEVRLWRAYFLEKLSKRAVPVRKARELKSINQKRLAVVAGIRNFMQKVPFRKVSKRSGEAPPLKNSTDDNKVSFAGIKEKIGTLKKGSSKKGTSSPKKRVLSILISDDYLVCTIQSLSDSGDVLERAREYSFGLFDEETPRSLSLSALLADFLNSDNKIDGAFLFLADPLVEFHNVIAEGMERTDVEAAIDNGSFWPNMISTSRDFDQQAIAYTIASKTVDTGSELNIKVALLELELVNDIKAAVDTQGIEIFSLASFHSAISGVLLFNGRPADAGIYVAEDGRTLSYSSAGGRYFLGENYLPTSAPNVTTLEPSSGQVHPVWMEPQFLHNMPKKVAIWCDESQPITKVIGQPGQAFEKPDGRLDLSDVNSALTKFRNKQRVSDAILISEYSNMLCASDLDAQVRTSELNFVDNAWDLFAKDIKKNKARERVAKAALAGAAVAIVARVVLAVALPDYSEVRRANDQLVGEVELLELRLQASQTEFDMLALRAAAISEISGNHREIYSLLISIMTLVPSQVILSEIIYGHEPARVTVRGVANNEVIVAEFLDRLSDGTQRRASLQSIEVAESGGFEFAISLPVPAG